MQQITAAVCRAHGQPFSIESARLDDPRADEILVRIAGVGICHTDIVAQDGGLYPIALPAVFGHEGAGEVVAVGSDISTVKAGDVVVLSFGSCGRCGRCQNHESAYCAQAFPINYSGMRSNGTSALSIGDETVSGHFFGQSSFASYAIAYESNTVVLPDGCDASIMGPLGCGIQTGAGTVINTLACKPGSSLLITGGGTLGLAAAMAAGIQGCATIIVSEVHASRRALALEIGATHAIDPRLSPVAEAVRGITPAGVDYAFDTTGLPDVMAGALASLGPRGTLAIAGLPPRPDATIAVPILPMIAYGQTIKGLVEGDASPKSFIPYLAELHRQGRLPIDRLMKKYPLSHINQAISEQQQGLCVKPILIPD
jgi:aryl-alcohol dehydrogenase